MQLTFYFFFAVRPRWIEFELLIVLDELACLSHRPYIDHDIIAMIH